MRPRLYPWLLPALLLLAACSSQPENPLAKLLPHLGFSPAPPNQEGELVYKKPVDGVSLWVSLPQGWGKQPGPVMMVKAAGSGGALSAATDQALTARDELGKLVEAASQGAYPPRALAEVLKLAGEAAARPPHNGALLTSPKSGYSLRVPHTGGHLRLVLVVRHARP
ncbi:MAG: hypothetical protein KJ720_13460 [Proteobacteria bacterium]|nr:hypothetical protein [Pseudomonadota bacterium]MBU1450171.1 hypothetical protein [Pseudomonadota bacterium]MBU2468919.1 hypothetical protein [Pseudomonadota bacterium]MBU2517387.1 hypothetical protein [Pseudomonadota bacterium]